LREGWLASAEALYERRIKREAKVGGVKWACAYIAPDDAPPTVPKKG